jgi:hypothetical protein
MKVTLLNATYWTMGLLIGLGAFGHGFVGVQPVRAALATVSLPADIPEVIWIVWYFVSGCMLLCGGLILWAWFAARHNPDILLVPVAIALLWVVTGVASYAYQHNPFWLLFLVEGTALLVAALALRREGNRDTVRKVA